MAVRTTADRELLQIGFEYLASTYDETQGRVVCPEAPGYPALRETLQYALALLLTGAPGRARQVIMRAPFGPCSFAPMVALHIAIHHGEALGTGARKKLEDYVLEQIPLLRRVRLSEGNVNQPLMAAAVLGVAADLYSRPEWRQEAAQRLEALRRQLSDTGSISEYNSPTYQAVTLAAMGFLAEHVQDASLRRTAQVLAERLWLDTMLHFHWPTAILAGPYSRAYADNSTGGFSLLAVLCHKVFPPPGRCFFDPGVALAYDHGHDLGFAPLLADQELALPVWAGSQYRRYPEQLISETHSAPYVKGGEAYPGGQAELVTYLTHSFALATASRPYSDGDQTEGFFLQWCREGLDMVPPGAAYMRYVVNDALVDAPNHYEELGTTHTRALLVNQGRWYALQRGHRALVLYHPKRRQPRSIHAMALQVLIPRFEPSELWLGGQRVNPGALDLGITAPADQALVWRDGQATVGLKPLGVTNVGGGGHWRVLRQGRHVVMTLGNYRGPARGFSAAELLCVHNGLWVEAYGNQEAYPEALCQSLQALRVEIQETRAGLRTVVCHTAPGKWQLSYDPFLQVIVDRMVDGAPVLTPPFCSESVCQGWSEVSRHGVSLSIQGGPGLVATSDGMSGVAMKLAGGSQSMVLTGPDWAVVCPSAAVGRIAFARTDGRLQLDILTTSCPATVEVRAAHVSAVSINGVAARAIGEDKWTTTASDSP